MTKRSTKLDAQRKQELSEQVLRALEQPGTLDASWYRSLSKSERNYVQRVLADRLRAAFEAVELASREAADAMAIMTRE